MSLPSDPKSDIQKAILSRSAILVAGTGVSIAASDNHPQASWTGLLKSGLELLRAHTLISSEDSAAHLHLLNNKPETVQFIASAQAITRDMSPKKLSEWLKDTIGSIKATKQDVLDALDEIRRYGNLLATTNYDSLLIEGHSNLSAVTWKDKDAFLSAYRKRETNNVLFLHGYWESPESVILDERSYHEIVRDQSYRDELTAIWRTSTWIYVGCGENGLSDPDIGLLLELYGKRARDAGHWDFCLVRNSDKDRFQRYFNEKGHNICAVSFGDTHDELPVYLRSLLPVAEILTAPSIVPAIASVQGSIPRPPAFFAEPDYIGSHQFVGRVRELEELSDWAAPADPTNLLLYEAIGGNGKSMLTWEWTTNPKHALAARPADSAWAGRFWYSFYERGTDMADFCQRALAYITSRPLEFYAKKKTVELKEELLTYLHAKPWLIVLDGLERVLVAYHRIDAAEVPDEEANAPTDKIASRNPCDAIRDEDNDLLRSLAGAAPSKILVSSRLTPRVLLNPSGQPLPGAKRITLPGLRPPDAEALLRSCGVEGKSATIQSYLTTNCDNHPLVIGILGGLIVNYLPNRGNFDDWVGDPQAGVALDLSSLDLIQRRSHILLAAIDALPSSSRQLLSTLALISDSVDFETLTAFNPHLPPEPEEVCEPVPPEESRFNFVEVEMKLWKELSEQQKVELKKDFENELECWRAYENAVQIRLNSKEFLEAQQKLPTIVTDLEQRGLLQWDGHDRKYNLHPVVRSVASGAMAAVELERHGQQVVDHFSRKAHKSLGKSVTVHDLLPGIQVVRTLIKMGHLEDAQRAYQGPLAQALKFNVGASAICLTLLRPFFPFGWNIPPSGFVPRVQSYLANEAGLSLSALGRKSESLEAHTVSLLTDIREMDWQNIRTDLCNIGNSVTGLMNSYRCYKLAFEVASLNRDTEGVFVTGLDLYRSLNHRGMWHEADAIWDQIDGMGRSWPQHIYRPGAAEFLHSEASLLKGEFDREELGRAEKLARDSNNHETIRAIAWLWSVEWFEKGEWAKAIEPCQSHLQMEREAGMSSLRTEAKLAIAKFQLGQLTNVEAHCEAIRLGESSPRERIVAELWLALGEPEKAKQQALAAYGWAWADGEPYVHRYELTKTTELLQKLNVPIPSLPPYDSTKDEPLPWEAQVRSAIEELRSENEAEKQEPD